MFIVFKKLKYEIHVNPTENRNDIEYEFIDYYKLSVIHMNNKKKTFFKIGNLCFIFVLRVL